MGGERKNRSSSSAFTGRDPRFDDTFPSLLLLLLLFPHRARVVEGRRVDNWKRFTGVTSGATDVGEEKEIVVEVVIENQLQSEY